MARRQWHLRGLGQSFSTSVQVSAVSLALNANGGSGSTQAVKGAVGAKVTVPANAFSRTGHTFTGWNTKANGTGTAYKPGAQYTLGSSDATLYAQWKLNTYTVQSLRTRRCMHSGSSTHTRFSSTAMAPPQASPQCRCSMVRPLRSQIRR